MGNVKATLRAEVNKLYFFRVEEAIIGAVATGVDQTLAFGETVAKKHAPVRKVTRTGQGMGARVRDMTDAEIGGLPDFVKESLDPVSGVFKRTGRRPTVTIRRSLAGREAPKVRIKGRTYKLGKNAREVRMDRNTGNWDMTNPKVDQFLSSRGRYDLEQGRGVSISRFAVREEREVTVPRFDKKTGLYKNVVEKTSIVRHGYRATLGGRLKREIKAIFHGGGKGGVIRGELVSPTEYARFVEFPTSRTAAQPYMRPARDAMERRLPVEIERALSRVGRSGGV